MIGRKVWALHVVDRHWTSIQGVHLTREGLADCLVALAELSGLVAGDLDSALDALAEAGATVDIAEVEVAA